MVKAIDRLYHFRFAPPYLLWTKAPRSPDDSSQGGRRASRVIWKIFLSDPKLFVVLNANFILENLQTQRKFSLPLIEES
jgi:hypothetical protein